MSPSFLVFLYDFIFEELLTIRHLTSHRSLAYKIFLFIKLKIDGEVLHYLITLTQL